MALIPPYPYFNGIDYVSNFFKPSPSLTLSVANDKYLQKKVSDIATATQNFSGGIVTPNINTNDILLNIATDASRTAIVHIGDGNLSSGNIHFGNGANATNNVNILNGSYNLTSGQTVGNVNILTSSTFPATIVGGNVNILTGTNKGSLNIGNTSSLLNIYKPISVKYTTSPTTGQIGEKIVGTVNITTLSANAQVNAAYIDLTFGVWFIVAHQSNGNLASWYQLLISTGSTVRQYLYGTRAIFGSTNVNNTGITINAIVQTTGTPTQRIYAVSRCNTSTTISNVFMYAYRIA